jgi:hypothetical protein
MARRSVSASSSPSSPSKKPKPPSSASRLASAKNAPAASEATVGAKLPATVLVAPAGEDRRQVDLVARISARFDARLSDALEEEIAGYSGPEIELSMPLDSFLHEASALACLAEWHAVPRGIVKESLAPHAARLGGDIAAQILLLCKLGAEAEILASQGRVPTHDGTVQRGVVVFRRLRMALEVLVEDGIEDQKDVAVAALRRQHQGTPKTIAKLASGLAAYAGMCRTLATELRALPGFDMALIDEASSIAGLLVSRSAAPRTATSTIGARRNAIVALVRARAKKLRLVLRYTFADHPSILKSAASAHHRERRRASKEKGPKPDALPSPAQPAPVDGPTDEDDRIPDDLVDDDE